MIRIKVDAKGLKCTRCGKNVDVHQRLATLQNDEYMMALNDDGIPMLLLKNDKPLDWSRARTFALVCEECEMAVKL